MMLLRDGFGPAIMPGQAIAAAHGIAASGAEHFGLFILPRRRRFAINFIFAILSLRVAARRVERRERLVAPGHLYRPLCDHSLIRLISALPATYHY